MKMLRLLLALGLSAPLITLHADSNSATADRDKFASKVETIELFEKYKLNSLRQQILMLSLIRNKKTESIKYLVNAGFDTNYLFKSVSPLYVAIHQESLEIVKILVNNGADVEFRDKGKESALKGAVRTGNIEIVSYLISQGADVNAAGKGDSTPLTTATYKGNKAIIELLINNGATLEHDDWSLLHYAARYNHSHLIDFLIKKGIAIDSRTNTGSSPLALASSKGNLEIVKQLLQHSPDLEVPSIKYKTTALMAASMNGHAEVVETLLSAGADIERVNTKQHDALWLAANNSHVDTVKVLLEATKHKNEALHVASSKGDFEVVRNLLKSGVDVRAHNEKGTTALHLAARHGHLNIVKLLHKNGADIHALSADKQQTPMMRAAGWGKKSVLKYLVEQGAEVDIKSKAGWTPALSTARHHSLGTLKFLMSHGADINETTNSGWTIVMLAVKGKKRKTLKYLLEQNLNLRLKNKKGQTALDIAKKTKDKAIIEMIQEAIQEDSVVSNT